MIRLLKYFEALLSVALAIVAACLFLGGIAVLALQCYLWFRNGVWTEISILDGAKMAGMRWNWIYHPEDFLGAHKILLAVPMSLALCFSSLIPVTLRESLARSNPF